MFKIALNAGHGIYTPGKRCLKALDPKETREWTLNARICEKVEEKLKAYTGYELIRLDATTGEIDVALTARTNKANYWGADFYLSIHHNAGMKGGSGGGIISIVYTSASAKSVEWQTALYNALIKHTGLKGNRSIPCPKQNLHECRESNMPCVLLELGFMDSSTDVPVILSEEYADKCATAIVEVLAEKGGLKKTTQPAGTEYRDKVITACEFSANTVEYLDNYKYSADLYKALWECLREGKKRY
jgi:N-acetylmuramoyl-L-alanine amidase